MLRKRSSRTNEPAQKTSVTNYSQEKRPLPMVPLAPPDFVIGAKVLRESFVEKEAWYAGSLSHVPASVDITRRSEVLSWMDKGYSTNQLTKLEQEVIISISAQNVKIMRRYPPEQVLLRVPIDELGSVVYLRDDDGHMVLMLHSTMPVSGDQHSSTVDMPRSSTPANDSTPLNCYLTVLLCDSRMSAEEICALVRQCFQLVYTEATMQFLDSQLSDGVASVAPTPGSRTGSVGSSVSADVAQESWRSISESGDGVSVSPAQIIPAAEVKSDSDIFENYMSEMRALLSDEERAEFNSLLRSRQQGAPFPTFCRRLLQLFTTKRIHLLEGFRPFVEACDRPYLDEFVAQHMSGRPRHQRQESTGSTVLYERSVSSGASSNWSDSSAKTRNLPASFDQRLSAISQEINSLESLVLPHSQPQDASTNNQLFSSSTNLRTARF